VPCRDWNIAAVQVGLPSTPLKMMGLATNQEECGQELIEQEMLTRMVKEVKKYSPIYL
jgi:hypothetical protein